MAIYGFAVPVCGRLVSDIVADKDREIAELKAANETAQRRLAAKQAVVDQVCRERDDKNEEIRKLKCELHDASAAASFANQRRESLVKECAALSVEVARLKGELANIYVDDSFRRATACGKIAKGEPCDFPLGLSECVNAVRKLRADYEATLREGRYYADSLSAAKSQIGRAREALA